MIFKPFAQIEAVCVEGILDVNQHYKLINIEKHIALYIIKGDLLMPHVCMYLQYYMNRYDYMCVISCNDNCVFQNYPAVKGSFSCSTSKHVNKTHACAWCITLNQSRAMRCAHQVSQVAKASQVVIDLLGGHTKDE